MKQCLMAVTSVLTASKAPALHDGDARVCLCRGPDVPTTRGSARGCSSSLRVCVRVCAHS